MSRRSFNDKLGNITASTYDAFGRLLTASDAAHGASYTYDGLGRRRSKTVDGVTTVYISAGDQEMVEYAGNTVSGVQTAGQMLRHFVYADGIDEPLDMMTPSTVASPANDTHRYIVPDAGGTVLALVDPTQTGSAALVSQYGYRPFGESTDSTGAYRFTSRRLDAETGLYYYRARMYSPALGRFLQPDPIGIKGGSNLYAYVNNDPLNRLDPTGLFAERLANAASDKYNLISSDVQATVQDAVPKANAVINGAYSVIPGVGNAFRELARGSGVLGPTEFERFDQESKAIGVAVTEAVQHPQVTYTLAKDTLQVLDQSNPLFRYYVGGRAAFGFATGLGPIASVGDTLRAVENSHNAIDSIIKGGFGGLPSKDQ